jgi:type 1 fimbria pilin
MRGPVQLVLFVIFLSAATANAQSNYATMSGTVADPQQKVVPGCTVHLTSQSTSATRQATTNKQGIFQISGLLPGDYDLCKRLASR